MHTSKRRFVDKVCEMCKTRWISGVDEIKIVENLVDKGLVRLEGVHVYLG